MGKTANHKRGREISLGGGSRFASPHKVTPLPEQPAPNWVGSGDPVSDLQDTYRRVFDRPDDAAPAGSVTSAAAQRLYALVMADRAERANGKRAKGASDE